MCQSHLNVSCILLVLKSELQIKNGENKSKTSLRSMLPLSSSHTAIIPWLYGFIHTNACTFPSASQSLLFLSHLSSSHYERTIWNGSTLWLKQEMKSGFAIRLLNTTTKKTPSVDFLNKIHQTPIFFTSAVAYLVLFFKIVFVRNWLRKLFVWSVLFLNLRFFTHLILFRECCDLLVVARSLWI